MNNFKFTDKNISDNPDDFSFSVYEIHKEQQTKENNRIILYNKILKQIFIKIKIAVETCESYIFFKLPEYIIGYPIYNITECVFYIQNFLTSKGFEHKYCSHLIIQLKILHLDKLVIINHMMIFYIIVIKIKIKIMFKKRRKYFLIFNFIFY
jgi:hypothetical protein